jgi:hypothetical protein
MSPRIAEMIELRGGIGQFHKLEPRERTDREKFLETFPTVAAEIGVVAYKEEARLFDAGATIVYPKLVDGVGFGGEWWREIVDRHTRNLEATEKGDLVESRFPLAAEDNLRWPKVKHSWGATSDPPARVVVVLTDVAGGATICGVELAAYVPPCIEPLPMTAYFS